MDQDSRSSHDEYSWSTIVTHPSSDESEAHCHHPIVDKGIGKRCSNDADDPDGNLPGQWFLRQSSEEDSREDDDEKYIAHDLIEDTIAVESVDNESDEESDDSEIWFRFV